MIYSDLCGHKVSRLGFGTMRLPLLEDGKTIDRAQTEKMIDYAIANGVNYFDTAAPYHEGKSEIVTGEILGKYPRESYFLATKYPGHQIAKSYNPAEIFEEQLRKCGVDYFDFYLLHNVNEKCREVYTDPKLGILEYFKEQKRLGRIRHLGFSTHAEPEFIEMFLDYADGAMEFCQIQMNYLDWTLQKAERKYEILKKRGVPMIIMESVRGGALANLPEAQAARLKAVRPEESAASWGYRWLTQFDNAKVILSGLSNYEQTLDNIRTFKEACPVTESDNALLADIAEHLKDSIPCTGCRYCCDGCPMGLDIPMLIAKYNDYRVAPSFNVSMYVEALPAEKKPSACISCGKCVRSCPQNINVPEHLKAFTEEMSKHTSWEEICRQREAAAEALKAAANKSKD